MGNIIVKQASSHDAEQVSTLVGRLLQELAPEKYPAKVGQALIAAAREFGKRCGWSSLEVGAPDIM